MAIVITARNKKYCFQGGSMWYADEHTPDAAHSSVDNYIVKVKNTGTEVDHLVSVKIRCASLDGTYTTRSSGSTNIHEGNGDPFDATICVTPDGSNTHIGSTVTKHITAKKTGTFDETTFVNVDPVTFVFPEDGRPALNPGQTYQIQMHMKSIPSWGPTGQIVVFRYVADIDDDIQDNVTLTYNANGGSGGPASKTVASGTTITIPSTKPSKSATLTYHTNTGSNEYDPTAHILPSSKYTEISSEGRARRYTRTLSLEFLGWSKTKITGRAGTSSDATYPAGSTITLTANTTLYAVWGYSSAIGTLPSYKSSGDDSIYRDTVSVSTPDGYICQPQDYRLDRSADWTSERYSRSDPVTSSTKIWKDTTIWALWEYRIRRFSDELGNYYPPTSSTFDDKGIFDLSASEASYYSELADDQDCVVEGQILWDKSKSATHPSGRPLSGYASANPDLEWKRYNISYDIYRHAERIGMTYVGWDTNKNADPSASTYQPKFTNSSSVKYSSNRPIQLYLMWIPNTYSVTFKLGYKKKKDGTYNNWTLLKVTGIPSGRSVPANLIPVSGKWYNGRSVPYTYSGDPSSTAGTGVCFKRTGPYGFTGWSESLVNITGNIVVNALWDFAPIWQMVPDTASPLGQRWVPYKPKED